MLVANTYAACRVRTRATRPVGCEVKWEAQPRGPQ